MTRPRAPAPVRPRASASIGLRAVSLVLILGVLAACTGVPTSGPIEQGPVVDSAESSQFIRVIAAPPSAGAKPEEIVRGFLDAHASLEQDHAIARRYLTADASGAWKPQASTLVYDQGSLRLVARDDRVRARFRVVAELGADGSLTALEQPERREVAFTLEQVAVGEATVPQWRISDPPDGILISTTDLRRAYRLHQTYFVGQRTSVLVPDGRMLPVVGASLPTTLAEAVLAGPSAWLSPGVRSSLPAGTELALGAVPVVDAVATVELSEQVLSATDQERRDLAAGLTWTLTELPDISAVQLRVKGEPFVVPGAPTLMDRTVWRGQAPDSLVTASSAAQRAPHYLLDGSSIVRVSDMSRTSLPIAVPHADSLVGLAVSLDQRKAAAIEPDGRGLWLMPLERGGSPVHIAGRDVSSVSFSVDGELWFDDSGVIRRVIAGNQIVDVRVAGKGLGPVTAIQPGRDGTQVALVVAGIVHVGVLERQEAELVVTSVRRIGWTMADAADLAWRDAATLDVLGRQDGEARQVLRLSIGSSEATGLGTPALPTQVAASPGALTLVAGGENDVYANIGLQWRRQDAGRAVAYP